MLWLLEILLKLPHYSPKALWFEIPDTCSSRVGVSRLFCRFQSRLCLYFMLTSLLVEAKRLFLPKCSVPQSGSQRTSKDSVSLSRELVLLCTCLQRPLGGRNSGPLWVKGRFAGSPSSLLYFYWSERGLNLRGSMKVFSQHWEHAGVCPVVMRAQHLAGSIPQAAELRNSRTRREILLKLTVTSSKLA